MWGLFKLFTTILACQGGSASADRDPPSRRPGATPLLITEGWQFCRMALRLSVDQSLPVFGVGCV